MALVRPALRRPALVALLVAYAGLGLSRTLAALLGGDASPYTGFALALELGSAAVTASVLMREPSPAPA